jgi:hypothetical protein
MTPPAAEANRGEVPLRGRRLRLLQTLWVVLVLIDLGTLFLNLLPYYHALFGVCSGPVTNCQITDQLNTQTLATLKHAGFSLNTYAYYVIFWDLLTTLSFLLVGAVIIWHRSNTWMGLFVSYLLINLGSLGVSFAHINGLPTASSNPLINLLFILGNLLGNLQTPLTYLCLAFFFFTFPDGRLVPRWSWILASLWLVNVFFWASSASPNSPFGIINWPPLLEAGWLSFVFGVSLSTQIYRFRRVATPIQRQQIKWLIFGFVPVLIIPIILTLYMTFVPTLNQPGAYLINTPNSFLLIVILPLYRFWYLPVPFCIGIALLRYRLWDIDRVINRTLVYGLLTAILLLIYLLLVFVGQYLLSDLLGRSNGVVLVGSTLLVAALFQPLRLRIQRLVDRRFYRRKYDAAKIVAAFSVTLRNEVDLNQLQEDLLGVIEETMQPAHVSLWLRTPESYKQTARLKPGVDQQGEM